MKKYTLCPLFIIVFVLLISVAGLAYWHSATLPTLRFVVGITPVEQKETIALLKKNNVPLDRADDFIVTTYHKNSDPIEPLEITPANGTYIKIQKLYKNIPISGDDFEFIFSADDTPKEMYFPYPIEEKGRAVFEISSEQEVGNADVEPIFSGYDAIKIAEPIFETCAPNSNSHDLTADLFVSNKNIAWRVAPRGSLVTNPPVVWIDAHTGEIILKIFSEIGSVSEECQ